MSRDMKPITMYECPHCKKLFKTPNKHCCRKDPDKTNCYSCEHWGHEFCFDKSYWGDDEYNYTCASEEACNKSETSIVESAHGLMRENGWYLNCPDYKFITAVVGR
jgi:hypothetical protein